MKLTLPLSPERSIPFLAFTALFLPVAALAAVAAARTAGISQETLAQRRVHLYFEAAHEPLSKIAPEIYALAADSERCRMNNGSKGCGLPAGPLNSSGLEQIFDYYVKGPVDGLLARQRPAASKSDWTWQALPVRSGGSSQ